MHYAHSPSSGGGGPQTARQLLAADGHTAAPETRPRRPRPRPAATGAGARGSPGMAAGMRGLRRRECVPRPRCINELTVSGETRRR